MVFVYLKKNPAIRLFSSFAHYKLILNPFFQHCCNKILTYMIFVIRGKSFSVLFKIPFVKIQIFCDTCRSFTWFVNYFLAKFLENRQVSAKAISLNFSSNCTCAAFNWVLSILKNLRIAGFFASLPFVTYLCYKRLKPSTHCFQLRRKIAKIERALSK